MPLEPWQAGLDEIRGHHVHNLAEPEKRLLAYVRAGLSDAEIAEEVVEAESSVRRQLANLEHRIFDFMDVPPTRVRLTLFAVEHERCCLKLAAAAE